MSRKISQKNLDADLLRAIKKNDLALVKASLENGANIHAENDRALVAAAAESSFEIFKFLLDSGANAQNKLALTWSFIRARKSKARHCKLLLDYGARITEADIIFNAKADNPVCCEVLLRHMLSPQAWRKKGPQAALTKAMRLRRLLRHGEEGPRYFISAPTMGAMLNIIEEYEALYRHEIRREALLARPLRPKAAQPPRPL